MEFGFGMVAVFLFGAFTGGALGYREGRLDGIRWCQKALNTTLDGGEPPKGPENTIIKETSIK